MRLYPWHIVKSLGPIDLRNLWRDELLSWMIFLPLGMFPAVRLLVPYLSTQIARQFGFDLAPYYTLIQSLLVICMPMVYGVLIGFLLLDQRDDRTLCALQVTPLTLGGYLAYRISLPIVLSVGVTLLMLPLAGLEPLGWKALIAVTLLASPLAPLFALFFGVFAENKVQGFALNKGAGVFILLPLVAYFVPGGWQWVFGLLPTFWPAKFYWMIQSGEPGAWLAFLIGIAYQVLLLVVLLRRFNRLVD